LLYLLDANVLIDANRDYYPIKRVPEFWEWLVYKGEKGQVKIPIEVYEEIKEGKDDLAIWAKKDETETALLFNEDADVSLVSRVTDGGYAADLTDDEVEKIGRDPFLIAYALASIKDRCIVTTEGSRPSRQRANKHVPDVCNGFGVRCCDTFEFLRDLNFSTKWSK
jgi:hypothetical protein